MKTLPQDLRFAFRQMLRTPGFAFTAVVTLTLGIAANVIVFGVLQALVLRPLDVPHPGQVVSLERGENGANFSFPDVRDIRDDNSVFSAVAADRVMDFGLESSGASRSVWGYEVSGQYFEVLPIKPLLGRLIQRADDDHPGAAEVAVLSFNAWKSFFNSDPAIVGKSVRLDKHPYVVIGVTPQGFYGTEKFLQPAVFVPMANEAELESFNWIDFRRNQGVWAIARIKDGVTRAQVQSNLKAVATRITRQFPKDEDGLSLRIVRPGLLGDALGGPARAFLSGIMALAAIVLLAACANLGSLFAARIADRGRELAIRVALGSTRWRIVRQVFTEASVIALAGGLCAAGFAWVALTSLAGWSPPTSFPIQLAVLPQPSLIVVACIVSLFAAGIFGMMPLRQILKADPNEALRSGSGSWGASRRWALRDILLAAQIALCCVAVTAALVALRSLGKSIHMNLGFVSADAVRAHFDLAQAGYTAETAAPFQRRLLDTLSGLPGVVAAGYANTTPLAVDQSGASVFPAGTTDMRPSHEAFGASFYDVSPGYLAASGTRLLGGRDFRSSDTAKSPAVAIVNQEFARRLFHAGSPIGRTFTNLSGTVIQIVGVVEDGRYTTLNEDPGPAMFFPMAQQGNTSTTLVVRTRPDASGDTARAMAALVRRSIHDLDSGIPIQDCSAWSSQLGLQLLPAQVASVALSLFGAFGLLLSITGTFGLASYTVTKRLRDLGIRVALGASARQIVAAALGRMLVLLGTGCLVGLALGVATSRLLSAVVYQASAQDPLVLSAVALVMIVTGLLSLAGPIQRALHLDPASILRES